MICLHKDNPAPVQFADRVSCKMYGLCDISYSDTIQELINVDSLVEWQGPQPPVVINGMGVVQNWKGKLRHILDCSCRYLNMFIMYERFA